MDMKGCLKGKNIFLIGGSGFMGKTLIEKIFRTVPNVGNIYVLRESKKREIDTGKTDGCF